MFITENKVAVFSKIPHYLIKKYRLIILHQIYQKYSAVPKFCYRFSVYAVV